MYLRLKFEHARLAGSRGMAVGRNGLSHSASNDPLGTFGLRNGKKTIKYRLLVSTSNQKH